MKVIFIGTVLFSEIVLKELIQLDIEIVGVLTKRKSDFNSDFVDLSLLCKKNKIDFRYFDNINNPDIKEWIIQKNPDVIFCFGLSQIIKKGILYSSKIGIIGYHPTLLPHNRGRHPLVWTIVLGLKETGSTFFFMDEGADTGDILSQVKIKIPDNTSSQQLYDLITQTSINQIKEFIPKLKSGKFKRIKQNNSIANTWRKRTKSDGIIDFRMSSENIHRLILALTRPYPGASLIHDNKEIKVWHSKIERVNKKNIEPGRIIKIINNNILVQCGKNAIWLIDHEFETLPKKGEYIL